MYMTSFPFGRASANSSPVFGVLTQPIRNSSSTMVAASYVKWLEAGGARSIPIPYDASPATVVDLLSQIDGILLPGGSSAVPESVELLWQLLRERYDEGVDMIPIWGTCLGFEYLLQLGAQDFDTILESGYLAENVSLPLSMVEPYILYRPETVNELVRMNNITMNNHHQGISPSRFRSNSDLVNLWKVTSVNADAADRLFVSTIEPRQPDRFPVYGVQFHPEKNAFEYATYPHTNIPYEAIDHSSEGITMSLYMASFLVGLARSNSAGCGNDGCNKYTKPDRYPLIYSYPVENGLNFEQSYIIPAAGGLAMTKDEPHATPGMSPPYLRISAQPLPTPFESSD